MGAQLIAWLTSNVFSSKSMFQIVMSLALIWQGTQLQQLNRNLAMESHKAKTEYAYNVLKYGYRSDTSEEEIIATTKKWVEDGWDAQIGALITLCEESPNRLNTLVSPQNVIVLCRYAR